MSLLSRKTLLYSSVIGSLLSLGGLVFAQTYYVQPGDSLYNIAARNGTTIAALIQKNSLASTSIYPGQALQIGFASGNSASTSTHTVRAGESLYIIARQYGISVETLQKANSLFGNSLMVGQQLTIPSTPASSTSATSSYTVQTDDTLYKIAQRNGIALSELLKLNPSSNGEIRPGQIIQLPAKSTSTSVTNTLSLSQSDISLLARLVSAEASGEPLAGQIAVAATILSRLCDPRYPKTIAGVIYQISNGRYQYSPVLDGRINQPATASAYQAVQLALAGQDPSNGANGFYNPDKTTNQWVRSHPVTATIGDHVFYYY